MLAMYVVFAGWVLGLCDYLISEIHDNVVVYFLVWFVVRLVVRCLSGRRAAWWVLFA